MFFELSKTGDFHKQNNIGNQDCLVSGTDKRFSVISLADGVSTCSMSADGAVTAAEAVTELFVEKGDFFLEFDKEKTADRVISHILFRLKKQAQEKGIDVREYSSTIASILYDKWTGKLLVLNLGDSLILASGNGKCSVLSHPSDSTEGCYVTTTKNAAKTMDVELLSRAGYDSVLICSDGAWRIMFEKNKMKHSVKNMIEEQNYVKLKRFMEMQDNADDCSFIVMDLNAAGGEEAVWEAENL